jgi:hypothetical protein
MKVNEGAHMIAKPLVWYEETVEAVRKRKATLSMNGSSEYVVVEEEANGTCWVYLSTKGLSGGQFVELPFEEAKQGAIAMIVSTLTRVLTGVRELEVAQG